MRITIQGDDDQGPISVRAELVGDHWEVQVFRRGWAISTTRLGALLPSTVAEHALTELAREMYQGDTCVQIGCGFPATHQRPGGATTDGTPIWELVCSRHGDVPRD
jgi:hypothetical protein